MDLKMLTLFCTACRKEIAEHDSILLLEDNLSRYFCTDSCAEKFYAPVVKKYKHFESTLQEKHRDSFNDDLLGDPNVIDHLLYGPNEVWKVNNYAEESVYHYISELHSTSEGKWWGIAVNLIRNFNPSFAITLLITKEEKFVNLYRVGEQIDDISPFLGRQNESAGANEMLSEDVVNTLEEYKSQVLAYHLQHRPDSDIPYESFISYDKYLQPTLDMPDEIRLFEEFDEPLWCYIKAGRDVDGAFFYLVVCLNQGVDEATGKSVVIPIFSFPTIDGNLYNCFRKGKQMFGTQKN